MLDGDHRVSIVDELLQNGNQLLDVYEVQTARRLIEDVEGRASRGLGEVSGELDALCFAAAQRGRPAPELEVTEAHPQQSVEPGPDRGDGFEERACLFKRQGQYLGDVQATIANLEGFVVVAAATAQLAFDFGVWQQLHLDTLHPLAFACRAAPSFGVEAEATGAVAARTGFRKPRKELSKRRESSDIGRRIRARTLPDRRRVDIRHARNAEPPFEHDARRHFCRQPQLVTDRRKQCVDHERAFAASTHSRHATQRTKGKLGAYPPNVVELVDANADLPKRCHAGLLRGGNPTASRKICAGERGLVSDHGIDVALGHDFTSSLPSARSHFNEVVCRASSLWVVLDHYEGVPVVPELVDSRDKPFSIGRMKTRGRLVEHVEHPGETGTELSGEMHPLRLSCR